MFVMPAVLSMSSKSSKKMRVRVRRAALVVLTTTCAFLLSGSVASIPTKASPTNQTPPPSPPTTSTPTSTKPILLTDPAPDPKQEGVQYFPSTGHTLRGSFLRYWQQYGGLAQFGYPLTEEFVDGSDAMTITVQYFERNRFERHPENQSPYDVLLSTLGHDFRTQDPPAAPQPAPALYFSETGHNLSGKFLEYWQTHGGLAVHGYPITKPMMERSTNGKQYLVQWFERSRMELHPENAGTPYEMLLGLLGRQLSEKKGYPYGWYPQYGRAVDYSWVAGDVQLYVQRGSSGPTAGCTLLRYEGDPSNTLMQLSGSETYHYSIEILVDQLQICRFFDVGAHIVAFGHLANQWC